MFNKGYFQLLLYFLSLISTSCVGTKSKKVARHFDSKYCSPAISYHYDSTLYPKPTQEVLSGKNTGAFSAHTLLVANAAGVYQELLKLDSIKRAYDKSPTDSTRIKYIASKNKVLTQVMLISTEIESIAAELDCEGERAEILADYLTERENRRNSILTVLSITSGALITIAGTLASEKLNDTQQDAITISGGVISASFGLSILLFKTKVKYYHKRNLLGEIWNDPENSKIFPPSIWYLLNEPFFSNAHEFSIVHNIKHRWKELKLEAEGSEVSDNEKQLLFGEGGIYTKGMLRTRSSMLNEVQASTRLMNQDLQAFILEITSRY
ncbi:MAG: hypothetical protein J7604_04855 [Sporocytophaga sp.]|uniref:hypothetical protein n=1 Tax=Sporocytophaga sp. TaxID=2231183 RepID=UPI001B011833|nr:hypothetical protein [Sporocytophaga sp.]MBO9699516.1 hypothetical protein [Sporocytophaga sp.]